MVCTNCLLRLLHSIIRNTRLSTNRYFFIFTRKYSKAYSGKDNSKFIEGTTFKTIISAGGVEVGGAIEGATEGVKEKLVILLTAIAHDEGKRVPDYREKTKLAESSIERYIAQLRCAGLIEFRGDAPQTGGYYLTEVLNDKLKL